MDETCVNHHDRKSKQEAKEWFAPGSSAPKQKLFKLSSITCLSLDESFIIFETCRLKAVKRDTAELSIYAKLFQLPITNVKLGVTLRKRNAYVNSPLYEYQIDGCAFFRNKRRNPLAELFYNFLGLKTHSNVNHSCPYDHDIILDRFVLNQNFASVVPLPVGSYLISTNWQIDAVVRANVSLGLEALDKN
ncbi:uncharacterized protein LOC128868826 [Anastrepha ludens]|uniref:uncharacterized protein LOC128868826 n=1 Tax=Anastrepha ludens TaxID=28586 RepID=UPI0023AFE779|nr:uncharacterized protein LOC128868826 [Anastrepha ludens]